MEDDRLGILTEEGVEPVSDEDVFYEQLSAEFDEDSDD
jgi:hypothetical protein